MSTILLVWEYERNFSHISRLYQLQKQLIQLGHKAYLIGSQLPNIQSQASFPFLFAPYAKAPYLHKPQSITKIGGYSDNLTLLGFDDAKTLYSLVVGWDHLFDLLRPDLLICDFAPVASLAAFNNIPVIQVSDGFGLPPHHLADFPRLRPDVPLLGSTQNKLSNIHYVQMKRKKAVPPHIPAILNSEYQFICHVPELDPYISFRSRQTRYVFSSNIPTHFSAENRKHFFACLDKNYPDFEGILIGLTELDLIGIFYIPDAPKPLQQFIKSQGMEVYDELPHLGETLAKSAWVIHHGIQIIAESALFAGIPQFTLPYHFENDWISHALKNLGVGVGIYPTLHPITSVCAEIKKEYKNFSLREWATLRAAHLNQKEQNPIELAILHACQAILH